MKQKNSNLQFIGCIALLLFANPTFSVEKGDPIRGKAKSSTCVACHGVSGNSLIPNFPNLAGQHALYLEIALKAYKNGDRKAPTMQPMAAALSEQDIKDLAAFYASQAPIQ
jgi:cytochrome c553